MGRRNATRLVAVVALLAVAAAVAVLVAGHGGSEDSDGPGTAEFGGSGGYAEALPPRPGRTTVPTARPRPDWRPYSGPVPVFRYHEVDEFPAGEPYPELFVEPADFRAQMDWLQAHGYEAVDLRSVESAWFADGTLPPKPVVLTFDGVEGELAPLVLRDLTRRGWPAVVVIDAEAPLPPRPLLDRLVATGWEVAAAGADPAASRQRLETALGTPVANYSFPPEAAENPDVAAVEAAGFAGAMVAGAGFATRSDPYAMPRITVFGLAGVDGFAEAMRSRGEGVGA